MKKILTVLISLVFLMAACDKSETNLVVDDTASLTPKIPVELHQYSVEEMPIHVKDHPAVRDLRIAMGLPVAKPDPAHIIGLESVVDASANGTVLHGFTSSSKNIPLITDAGATLGRVLFYDRSLSITNTVSCGSCHVQALGFADGRATSPGFRGVETKRNSMAILNAGLNENMFWDARAPTVRTLVLNPISDHIEMGMESLGYLNKKLAQKDYYAELFKEAFGSSEITSARISDALTQFVCSMTTFDSKFDRNMESGFSGFSEKERLGHDLFFSERAQCGSCHALPNFAAPDFPGGAYGAQGVAGSTNIGLDKNYIDQGRGEGRFRIPSLRNIALTGPYMHDGRFTDLMEVVDHYDHGIKSHAALDEKLKDQNGLPQRLQLSAYEKAALVAFMETLTSDQLLQDEKFSDPFNY